MNKKIKSHKKIGIIGCGHWGVKWIKLFSRTGVYIKACCDIDRKRLEMLAKEVPYLNLFEDYTKILGDKDIDAVYIATPPPSHYRIARESLLAGKHVLVEKPLTTSYKEGLELVQLAKKVNRILMVGNSFIYNKAIQELKHLINSGEVGSLRYIHIWMTDSVDMWEGKLIYNYTNVLWDLGPHPVSILYYLIDKEALAVSATSSASLSDKTVNQIYDAITVNMYFPQGVAAALYLNWLDHSRNRRVLVAGKEGVLTCGDFTSRKKTEVGLKKFSLSGGWLKERESRIYQVDVSNTLEDESKHFIHCIMNGRKPITDGGAGAAVVKVLEAAQRSMDKGGTVESI